MADNKEKMKLFSQKNHQIINAIMADNLISDDAIAADNAPDIELLLADTTTIQAENTPDSIVSEEYNLMNEQRRQADDNKNIDSFDKMSLLELQKKYQIKRDALYKRMAYLRITTWKVSGKACLYPEQVAHMDGLHKHMKGGQRMNTYPKPEPTGPCEEEDKSLHIVKDEPYSEDNVKTPSSIVVSPNGIIEATVNTSSPTVISQADIEEIKLEAQQRIKAKRLAVTDFARDYEGNPDKLPFEIQQEIEEAEMASISTPLSHRTYYDPKALAQLVIQSL